MDCNQKYWFILQAHIISFLHQGFTNLYLQNVSSVQQQCIAIILGA